MGLSLTPLRGYNYSIFNLFYQNIFLERPALILKTLSNCKYQFLIKSHIIHKQRNYDLTHCLLTQTTISRMSHSWDQKFRAVYSLKSTYFFSQYSAVLVSVILLKKFPNLRLGMKSREKAVRKKRHSGDYRARVTDMQVSEGDIQHKRISGSVLDEWESQTGRNRRDSNYWSLK